VDIVDAAVQYLVYRLTWKELQTQPGGITRLMVDIDSALQDFIAHAKKGARNEEVRKKFNEQMVARLKEVLGNPLLIARVNAARALSMVAENGFEDVADALLEILQDSKQSDAVRYWAVHGLRELFRAAHQPEPVLMRNKEREEKSIQALIGVIEHKGPAMGLPEEIEGARVYRREAVRALALTRYPALVDVKDKKVKARPALVLLRVLAEPGRLTPSPRLDEQVEAAIGLAKLQAKLSPDYQPDYAAEHIARFIVKLAERYEKEGKKGMEPWKVHAARIGEALELMKIDASKNAKDKEAAKYVTEVVSRVAPVLTNIEKGTTANAASLSNWVNSTPAKSAMLFRGAADTAIKSAEPAEKQ
jgi:hypothetical protein